MIELCEATEDNPFIHGMSKQFVAALQQLFDVMDTEQSGTIHFADLANQWEEDDGDPFFPRGLIACLAKVKLPNGMLTFDRFCAGIKLCLLKNQVDINDVRMITSMTDECRSMTTSDSSITIPNGGDLNSHSQLLPPPAPSLSTSVDRPSSEPQIFAPPPPSSLSSPTPTSSSNKTAEVNNNNIIYTNNPKLTNTATCLQQIQPTEITSATKKLPLPSYEQVMAAKSKPKVPPPVLSTVSHNSNSDQSPTATASTNSLNKESHQQKQPSKTAKQFPHLSQHQLEEIKRVVNHRYLESQYGHTSGNRPSINNDNQQPLQHQQACRAKSMPHLIDVSHNSPSSFFSFNTADHLNYSQQIPMNYQTHLLNHHHSHTYQRHPTTNENRKDQHINYHNSSANSIISDNNEQTPIVKTIINDGNAAPKTVSRNCIMKTLQNWRDNILSKHPLPSFNDLLLQTKNTGTDFHWPRSLVTKSAQTPTSNINCQKNNDISHLQASPIINDDGLNDQEFVAPVISVPNENNYIDNNDQSMAMFSGFQHSSLHRRSSIRQHRQPREPRRHTVGANGIDLYAVKRFQQLEQEKDILIGGLAEIERTKEWYLRQISVLQNRINIVSRSGGSSFIASDYNNIDAYQERINFQAVRIQTLNQHLTALRDVGQNFPIHMNLAIRPLNGLPSSIKSIGAQLSPQSLATGRIDPNQPRQLVVNPNLVNKLKEQNRLLTDEVTRKSDRITQLEREKSSLIRELFQARTYSSYYNGHFDDTFM